MKEIIEGKLYDTKRCEVLATKDHRNNGNYSGQTALLLARNGDLLLWTDSNGQDSYLRDSLDLCHDSKEFLNGADFTEEQEERLLELGLIEIV